MTTRPIQEILEQLRVTEASQAIVGKTPAVGVSVTLSAAAEQAASITDDDYRADSGAVQAHVNRAEAELLWDAGAKRE